MDVSWNNACDLQHGEPVDSTTVSMTEHVLTLLLNDLSDQVDHPEIWQAFPQFIEQYPDLIDVINANIQLLQSPNEVERVSFIILAAMAVASAPNSDVPWALDFVNEIATNYSLSPLVQGAVFHLMGMNDPHNPKYDLTKKFCPRPFHEIDVLDGISTLCCASWLDLSVGNMASADQWQDVWNSHNAERIRASIHDGSYRHCNKGACPAIQANLLKTPAEIAAISPRWEAVIAEKETCLPFGPDKVNLAYDRTCNLSCPSCRVEKYAANSEKREQFDRLQEGRILPMLKTAKIVLITGSGDPFASKNFRKLMDDLDAEAFPDLRFIIMTNGMLLTRQEWLRFPALHHRVQSLQISLDAATGPTHELLRRGARWEVMEENLQFASELLATGQVAEFHLNFTVQAENYWEMGDAVDLTHKLDATSLCFGRMTNWGTFSAEHYQRKAVFDPQHPLHEDFLEAMRDPRLRDKKVHVGNLINFLPEEAAAA